MSAHIVKCPACGLVNHPRTPTCRRCGAPVSITPYAIPTSTENDSTQSLHPPAQNDQTLELLQVGIVIVSVIAGIGAAVFVGYYGFGVGPAVASLVAVMVLGSIGGLLGLNAIRERRLGKDDRLLSPDTHEELTRLGLTSGEIATIGGAPILITSLVVGVGKVTTWTIVVVVVAFGLLWSAALILGQYRVRRNKRSRKSRPY